MKRLSAFTLAIIFFVPLAQAQGMPDPNVPQGENLQVPEGWEIRFDNPEAEVTIGADPETADLYFVNMTPGWHITTGPRAIFYHPANVGQGNFKISTKLHLFDPNGRNREGYGLFFGGSDLKGDGQKYIYFLLRNTGEFLVKYRVGAETNVIQDWKASDAIKVYGSESESSVENNLSVQVVGNDMIFSINNVKVVTVDSGGLETDGIFGLRVNHAVNLHVGDLSISKIPLPTRD